MASIPDFVSMVQQKLIKAKCPPQGYSVDLWHGSLGCLRKFLRGWNSNIIRKEKREKKELLSQLEKWDKESEF